MFRKISLPVLSLIFLSIAALAHSGNANYSGEWKLDMDKSDLSESPLYLSKIKINQEGNSLLTTRTYMSQNGEQYPFDEEIIVDGEEREIVIYEMKRKTSARWSEDGKSLLIKSVTRYYGDSGEEEILVEETISLNDEGTILSIGFTTNSVYGENAGTYLYNKADQ